MSNQFSHLTRSGSFVPKNSGKNEDFNKMARELGQDMAKQYEYMQDKIKAQAQAHIAQGVKQILQEGFDSFSLGDSVERFTDKFFNTLGDELEDFAERTKENIAQRMDEVIASSQKFDKTYMQSKEEARKQAEAEKAAQEAEKQRKREGMQRKAEEHRAERARAKARYKAQQEQEQRAKQQSSSQEARQDTGADPAYAKPRTSSADILIGRTTTTTSGQATYQKPDNSQASDTAQNSKATSEQLSPEESAQMQDILSQLDTELPAYNDNDDIIDFAKLVEQTQQEQQEQQEESNAGKVTSPSAYACEQDKNGKAQAQAQSSSDSTGAQEVGLQGLHGLSGFNPFMSPFGTTSSDSKRPQASAGWVDPNDIDDDDDDDDINAIRSMSRGSANAFNVEKPVLESDLDLDAELSRSDNPQAYMLQLELEAQAAYQEYLKNKQAQKSLGASGKSLSSEQSNVTEASAKGVASPSFKEPKTTQATSSSSYKLRPDIAQELAKLEAEGQAEYQKYISEHSFQRKS